MPARMWEETTRVPLDRGNEEEINTFRAEKLDREREGGRISSRRNGGGGGSESAAPMERKMFFYTNRPRKRIRGIRLCPYYAYAPYPQKYGQVGNLFQPNPLLVPSHRVLLSLAGERWTDQSRFSLSQEELRGFLRLPSIDGFSSSPSAAHLFPALLSSHQVISRHNDSLLYIPIISVNACERCRFPPNGRCNL